MSKARLRTALASDVAPIRAIVRDAYEPYVERIGREPAPMLADYERLVAEGLVWVLEIGGTVGGLVILEAEADHVLVSNVAVASAHRGRGFGRTLLDHAEAFAREKGVGELRLYTHERMHENVAIYAKLGWAEERRAEEDGFRRVFLRKRIHSS